ncbi:hypothetical protein LINGRAHAP2_LOCUS10869, partial [Linum grandiflorum]
STLPHRPPQPTIRRPAANLAARCPSLPSQELKGLRGPGWDESRKMALLDDHVYADYVASHKDCAKMNRVPFRVMTAWSMCLERSVRPV